MLTEGETAPGFELPAVVDGEFETVTLDEYLDDNVVVLAFYPADFNPSCSGERSGLDDLDLFTMQKDVTILGLSGDSVYSHRRFAEEYALRIPLLADVDATVASAYGVAADDPRYRTRRAVFVVGPGGEIQYAWAADELGELPDVDELREAVESVGGDDTAQARYRVGHAHYVEGRRAFTSAMSAFDEKEWMLAQSDFAQARDEFEEAADLFDTAARFGTDELEVTYYDRATDKAEALWQAADWLAGSASAFASGEGAEGQQKKADAETPLETARDIHDPPDPDDFPPDEPPEGGDQQSVLADEDREATLGGDLAEATEERDTAESETETMEAAEGSEEPPDEDDTADDSEDEIGEEELEEITAELEEQTAKAEAKRKDEDDFSGMGDVSADTDEESAEFDDEGDIELDLADPTEGDGETDERGDETDDDDEETGDDDDLGSHGNHGVPDSL